SRPRLRQFLLAKFVNPAESVDAHRFHDSPSLLFRPGRGARDCICFSPPAVYNQLTTMIGPVEVESRMPAAITCTSCNRPLRVPESVLGRTVQCPLCLDEFTAQAATAAEAAAQAADAPARRAAARPQPVGAH